ncbi:FG-GAP repeat domain-containing protein [Actinocorallia lasiicapitis]
MRRAVVLSAGFLCCALVPWSAPARADGIEAAKAWDFNGDGRPDKTSAGPAGVKVVYKGGKPGAQTLTRASAGIPGEPDGAEEFGASRASADFDHDGYADLALSGPGSPDTVLVYGSRKGLAARTLRVKHSGEVRTGDVNGDGKPDLLVFTEGPNRAVKVLLRGKKGFARTVTLAPGRGGLPGPATTDPALWSLALGDIDGDRRTDLAIGTPSPGGGSVTILYGSSPYPRFQARTQVIAPRRPDPGFGATVRIVDQTRDHRPDLKAGSGTRSWLFPNTGKRIRATAR